VVIEKLAEGLKIFDYFETTPLIFDFPYALIERKSLKRTASPAQIHYSATEVVSG
jgi:hypothetical protein